MLVIAVVILSALLLLAILYIVWCKNVVAIANFGVLIIMAVLYITFSRNNH